MRLIATFFYLYPISFVFIPFGFTSRIILSLVGIGLITYEFFIINKTTIRKKLVSLIVCLLILAAISILSITINGTKDLHFLLYPISMCFVLFSGYLVCSINNFSNEKIVNSLIIAILLQNIISITMYVSPSFSSLLLSIQNISELDQIQLNKLSELRINGFGSTFFGAGILNGIGLLLSTFRFSESNCKIKRIQYSFFFLIIFFVGMLTSRTTIIGFILSIFYLLVYDFYIKSNTKKLALRLLFNIVIIGLVSILILLTVFPKFIETIQIAINFGFEMFVKYFQYGTFESESTNQLQEMYKLPSSIKSYIIGDGLWDDPQNLGLGYYMGTDIGYLRLIYYFGIIGACLYFYFQYISYKIARNRVYEKSLQILLLMFFIFSLVLNFKGFADLFFIYVLFIFMRKETLQHV